MTHLNSGEETIWIIVGLAIILAFLLGYLTSQLLDRPGDTEILTGLLCFIAVLTVVVLTIVNIVSHNHRLRHEQDYAALTKQFPGIRFTSVDIRDMLVNLEAGPRSCTASYTKSYGHYEITSATLSCTIPHGSITDTNSLTNAAVSTTP